MGNIRERKPGLWRVSFWWKSRRFDIYRDQHGTLLDSEKRAVSAGRRLELRGRQPDAPDRAGPAAMGHQFRVQIIDDRLYSDLGISGYLREPDMNNYRDEEGNLTDQSGNLVDEYGYLLEDGGYEEEPQEEYMAEDMAEEEPAMAGGGTTHYTFGRVMNPAENLGLAEGMKKGGLSQAHTVHSHQTNPVVNNRVDFRKGSAVNGAGDGQSDDIPAWLADGEYVMDAELVSMLGNGSNKAGAKVLDKFRENIRAHKRGAPLGKIPPKAKSPLNYLKESMNG
jgi:hypothetical protein